MIGKKISLKFSRPLWQFIIFTAIFFAGNSLAQAATITVDSLNNVSANDGVCTLTEAITSANNNAAGTTNCTAGSGTDIIEFSVSGTISISGANLTTITSPMTIDGGGNITIDAANTASRRIFNITGTTALTVQDIILLDGNQTNGGCIQASTATTLTLIAVTFDDCHASGNGGAIYIPDGTSPSVSMTDVTFTDNSADGEGGAIYADDGTDITATNLTATGNQSPNGGGAVLYYNSYQANSSNVVITGVSDISSNYSLGGAIAIKDDDGHLITGVNFYNNTAGNAGTFQAGNGGAIQILGVADITISNNIFDTNITYYFGSAGAIEISDAANAIIEDNTFIDNESDYGGAIHVAEGNVTIRNNAFLSNEAVDEGGAIYLSESGGGGGVIAITNNTFDSNVANADGGGAIRNRFGNATIYNNTFTNNSTPGNGAVFLVDSGSQTTFANNIFDDNTGTDTCAVNAPVSFTNQGNNLFDSSSGCSLQGSDITSASAGLGTLALNGGTTLNREPQGGSAVIDAASATYAPADDQRGVVRPIGSGDDIGAIESGADLVAPVIAEVTPVPSPTNDTTPNYTFSSDEAGTISYGGDCSSATTSATVGNNTVTFNTLSAGAHTNCTITVTDAASNVSNLLNVTSFTITAPTPRRAIILFQNDDFTTFESSSLVLNADDELNGDMTIKFGNTIGQTLTWNESNGRFDLSGNLDLSSNQLIGFRTENVTALPGGGAGLGGGGTGRLVMLTSTDSTAPGCTVNICTAGIYSWTGSAWLPLFKGVLGGNNNDVQYNDSGSNGGEDAFEYDATNNQLTIPGANINEDLALTGDISPTQLTANQNDYDPTGLATASTIRLTADSSFPAITGLAGGSDGRVLMLHNIGVNSILLKNQSTASTAANRFDFGNNDVPLLGGNLMVLQYDATSSRWRAKNVKSTSIPTGRRGMYHFHDMLGAVTDSAISSQVATGTNSATAVNSVAGHPGIVRHSTGASATGRAGMLSTNVDGILLGNFWYWRFEAMVRITTLSTAAQTYIYRVGFIDSATGEPVDGVYFRYTHGVNSGRWELVCRAASTETATASTTAPAAATWYRLTIIVNPAGDSAEFFVNGTSIGTCASNLPTGGTNGTGFGSNLIKSLGTTARTIDLDYLEIASYANTN
jgi:predicted outer membrane repeat protein